MARFVPAEKRGGIFGFVSRVLFFSFPREVASRENDGTRIKQKIIHKLSRNRARGEEGSSLPESFSGAVSKLHGGANFIVLNCRFAENFPENVTLLAS